MAKICITVRCEACQSSGLSLLESEPAPACDECGGQGFLEKTYYSFKEKLVIPGVKQVRLKDGTIVTYEQFLAPKTTSPK